MLGSKSWSTIALHEVLVILSLLTFTGIEVPCSTVERTVNKMGVLRWACARELVNVTEKRNRGFGAT